ncbi:MAG: BolA/IbaG family iron-sulfur metabolism protein [Litoreibacter sp.]|nr:BolA/IbaG family iron-sulfur metabolism protein [Litoreibacter sp.]MCY4334487.1 BolA/IbaG family iron-sulfur metabolism protein [Litoreibacter sp.]
MAMTPQEIEDLIRTAFPDAQIQIEGADGVHFSGVVIDESFRGMNRVQQQRAVMATLKSKVDSGELHALGLTTKAPE